DIAASPNTGPSPVGAAESRWGGRLTPGTPQIAVATEGESMCWKNLWDNSIQLRAMSRRRKNLKNLLYVSYEGMRQVKFTSTSATVNRNQGTQYDVKNNAYQSNAHGSFISRE